MRFILFCFVWFFLLLVTYMIFVYEKIVLEQALCLIPVGWKGGS